MRKIFTCILLLLGGLSAQQLSAQSTNLSVLKFLTDTAFTCIAVSESGDVYAGTNGKGMVRYDKEKWQLWNGYFSSIARGNLRQIAISNDSVWIASSGYVLYLGSGEAGNNINFLGGMHLMGKKNNFAKLYYKGRPVLGQMPNQGPPTRNVLGVAIDAEGKPWCAASYHDSMTYPAFLNYNARYHFAPGAVGKFNYGINNYDFITGSDLPDPSGILIGVGNNYKDESYSIGKRRTCRAIAKVGNEMWVASDGYDQATGNTITAGILRYDLAGNYLGKYDQNNTAVPFGLTNSSMAPWALYQDAVGRVWAGMNSTRGLAVLDTNGVWTHIGLPAILNNGQIRANAITGNSRGEVFFGTNSGLLMYKGTGSFLSDTSYTLYTTANGLSSNTITGVAIAKDESIWLATGAGVNKINKGNLFVYNLFRDALTPSVTDDDNFRRIIAVYDSKYPQSVIDKDTLFIAADSSKATILKWTGSDPKNVKFRIKDGAAVTNPQEHGRFVVKYLDPVANDSIRVQYYHPSYIDDLYTVSTQFNGKAVRLEVVDTTANPEIVMLDIPVKFVLPPVLMMHGIWSDGGTWDELKEYFLTNGLYRYKPYEILTPSYPSDREFTLNRTFVSGYIDDLIKNCGLNRMSAGKVDVVGHSMGGILTRLYLQEGVGAVTYKKNIHKLVTINTPHSGSPLANIVADKDDLFKWIMKKVGKNPYNGALDNLSIGKAAIDSLLNGPDLNKNIVPSHAIHTTDVLPAWAEFANDRINSFAKSPIKLKPRPYFNVTSTGSLLPNPWVIGAKAAIFGIKYYLMSGTSCPWDTQLNPCLEKVFGGKSDLIVSDSSQLGGMYDAETYIDGFNHLNVHTSPPAYIRVLELFRANTNSNLFSRNGFHPRSFRWDPVLGTQSNRNPVDSVRIINPSYGAAFNRGDSVHVTVRASAGIGRMLFAMGYENDMDAFAVEAPDSVFSFKIPDNVLDRINYKIFGFDAGGNVVTDSSYITIGVDPQLVLDSIKIAHYDRDNIKVIIADSTNISVMGYYSDGIARDITYQTGLAYSTLTSSVNVSAEGDVRGLIIGFDELKATFLGKTDSVTIEVIPRAPYDTVPGAVLPVRFSKINARFLGKLINVSWSTSMELNNSHFDIEHSIDGRIFIKAGSVPATNFPNGSNYSFDDYHYITGKNYYRIKQIDTDGKRSYSAIVVVNVPVNNGILVYPNPVEELLIIDFSGVNGHKGGMLRVVNAAGQVLHQQNIAAGSIKTHLNVASLVPGIYNIEIVGNDKKSILTERFIKNRK
jgi:pimeloyl-ACP methyl ester carboxylesterase